MSATVAKQSRCSQPEGKRNRQKQRKARVKRKQVTARKLTESGLSSNLDTPHQVKIGSLLYIKEKTDCLACSKLLLGSPRRLECCGAVLCERCAGKKRHKIKSLSCCPFCKTNNLKYIVDEELGKHLSLNKKTIRQAMGKYRIQYRHIPDDELLPEELMSSQRYFETWGRAVHTGQYPCNHEWTSRRAFCVLDLKKQCIAYSAPKRCLTCKNLAKTNYDVDSLSRMAEYASRSYLRLSGKKVTYLQEWQKRQLHTELGKQVTHKRKEQQLPTKQVKQLVSYNRQEQQEQFTLLGELDDMIALILKGTINSATYVHWIHHTHHTMYGHDYWRSRL